jgi:hypothetical protein
MWPFQVSISVREGIGLALIVVALVLIPVAWMWSRTLWLVGLALFVVGFLLFFIPAECAIGSASSRRKRPLATVTDRPCRPTFTTTPVGDTAADLRPWIGILLPTVIEVVDPRYAAR